MRSFFSFIVILILKSCIKVVLCQCPSAPGPVTIIGTSIADTAYLNCQTVTSLVIPSTLTFIGNYYIIYYISLVHCLILYMLLSK